MTSIAKILNIGSNIPNIINDQIDLVDILTNLRNASSENELVKDSTLIAVFINRYMDTDEVELFYIKLYPL